MATAVLAFLWTALLTLPLMTAVQEICDRTALATGTGLGELAVRHFHRAGRVILAVLLGALIVANGLNIAADLVAIGSGMQLLHAGPTWLWALVAGILITALLVLGSFARIALAFKLLCAALLSYLVVAVLVTHQWGSVLSHTHPPYRAEQGLPGAPGRRAGHDHLAVPVLLAERPPPRRDAPRTRGRDQGTAPQAAEPSAGPPQAGHQP
jgi:Mn2+/Fe2+ NRAMP family transporter